MNFSLIALVVVAGLMLSKRTPNQGNNNTLGMDNLLSEEAKSVMDSISNITSKDGDKMSALINLATNPSVIQLASAMLGNMGKKSSSNQHQEQSTTVNDNEDVAVNDNGDSGYRYSEGSQESREFFSEVKDVAGTEVSSKLYALYDNFYVAGKNQ